ncbi:PadR family transcriptional regulator [Cohnella nanjingensis]|uniref:Helix-turn-helix transcriptional regulator n=1 Tax=Cohnella nanjingensis TaxID=1387779 RepID=A0A7X0VG95_9BACL|nr:helix-turn-helix transcriptional regulator [Cohnella nanjingensis]MBB6672877.1 helix-turn-helix transcriptional regulator [Cohnella nanjingensis]
MSMKLLILGLLMENDRHPYDIRQTMIARNWNHAFKIRDGSLYYAVDQLREKGWIEAAEVIPVPGEHRPDKTIYRITAAGREAFSKLFYDQLEQQAHPQHPMMVAMPFLRHGDQARIAEIARRQLEACDARIAQLEETVALRGERMPGSARQMIEGMLMYGRAEREWLQETLAEAKAGRYAERKGEDGKWHR